MRIGVATLTMAAVLAIAPKANDVLRFFEVIALHVVAYGASLALLLRAEMALLRASVAKRLSVGLAQQGRLPVADQAAQQRVSALGGLVNIGARRQKQRRTDVAIAYAFGDDQALHQTQIRDAADRKRKQEIGTGDQRGERGRFLALAPNESWLAASVRRKAYWWASASRVKRSVRHSECWGNGEGRIRCKSRCAECISPPRSLCRERRHLSALRQPDGDAASSHVPRKSRKTSASME